MPDAGIKLGVALRLAHFHWISGTRKIDAEGFLDATGAGREQDDAISKREGFAEVVRYEYHGLLPSLPEAQKYRMHVDLRMCVERAERLVHEQDLRLDDNTALSEAAFNPEQDRLRIRSLAAYPKDPCCLKYTPAEGDFRAWWRRIDPFSVAPEGALVGVLTQGRVREALEALRSNRREVQFHDELERRREALEREPEATPSPVNK